MSNAALPFRMYDKHATTTFAGDDAARLYALLSALMGDEEIEAAGLPPDAARWAHGVLARMESTYALDPFQHHPWLATAATTICG